MFVPLIGWRLDSFRQIQLTVPYSCARYLGLDGVLATEHVVNLLQVVSTLGNGLSRALWGIVLLEVSLLAEVAKLIIDLWCDCASSSKSLLKIDSLLHLLSRSNNLQRQQRGSQSRSVREDTNLLALELLRLNVGEKGDETTPDGATVHVSAHSWHFNRWLHALSELLLGKTHEGLLDNLVGDRLLVLDILDLSWDVSEDWGLWVGEVIVVKEASVGLGDQLAGWCVEGHVVESVDWGLWGRSILNVAVGNTVGSLLKGLLASVVGLVASINSLSIAGEREVSVDNWVLGGQVWLVEIVCVLHIGTTESWLNHNWGVWTDEHGDGTSSAGWAGATLGVKGDISGDDNGITSVPCGGLDPGDGVEEGVGSTVAGVQCVNTLNVSVLAEKLHEDRLDGLGLVENGLSSDLEASDGVCVDVVFGDEVGAGGQGEGVDV